MYVPEVSPGYGYVNGTSSAGEGFMAFSSAYVSQALSDRLTGLLYIMGTSWQGACSLVEYVPDFGLSLLIEYIIGGFI